MKNKKRLPRLRIKATVTRETITLVLDKRIVVVKKNKYPDQFNELHQLLKKKSGPREIENNFDHYLTLVKIDGQEIVQITSDYTGRVKLRNTSNYVPADVLKKLMELESVDNESMLSILKFWYKLDRNPSASSRQQLFRFIIMNNIPITEEGDIVMEKGVKRAGSLLVDIHTSKIDNSIDRVVSMNRDEVQDNPKQTCSSGLHCAPPDYVRQWYNNDIIVKVLVNPVNVVSVPVDYESRKVRVCQYQVIGYSNYSTAPIKGGSVVKLSDLIESDEVMSKTEKKSTKRVVEDNVTQSDNTLIGNIPDFSLMKAAEIVSYVKEHYNQEITLTLKNKRGIVKRATTIAQTVQVEKHFEEKAPEIVVEREKTITLPGTISEMIRVAKSRLNEYIHRVDGKKANKIQVVSEFIRVFTQANYKVKK